MKKIIADIFVVIFILISSDVYGAKYYIDYATGSDANKGTSKSTPWKRAPGMLGSSGNVLAYETTHDKSGTTGAGDAFIFKGGVTWPNDCYSWIWRNGGGTGWTIGTDAVYFGVDSTWYTGGSWVRPIFDAEATDVSSNSKSSPATDNVMWRVYNASSGYIIIDNLEFKGMYHFDNNEDKMLNFDVGIGEIKNCYFHGWGHGAVYNDGPCNDLGDGKTYDICNRWVGGDDADEYCQSTFRVIATPYDDQQNDIRIHNCYIDGSDSYPTSGDLGNAVKGYVRHFYNNYVTQVQNALTSNFCKYVWGNTFDSIAIKTDLVSNNHRNLYQSYSSATIPETSYVFNNYVRDTYGGATFLWYPLDLTVFIAFNNVVIGDYNKVMALSSQYLTSNNAAGLFAFNNTLQLDASNEYAAIGGPETGNPAETFFVKNNHLISTKAGLQPNVDFVNQDTATNLQHNNNAATTAGYTNGSLYPYAPQSSDALTVNTGTDLSSISGILYNLDPSYPSVAFLSDATLGVSIDTNNHTVSYPYRTPVKRSTWDIGAYRYFFLEPPNNLRVVIDSSKSQ